MSNFQRSQEKRNNYQFIQILSILAILAWGILLLKYAITGQYQLLIHPNYFALMLLTSILLLTIGILKTIQLQKTPLETKDNEQHLTLFPPGIGSSLLLITAIAGLIIPPTVLSSQTALQRGVTETLPLTRYQPQTFVTQTKPEERSLIQWVRTLNAYPEPDAYKGQTAKITGFVIQLPELPDNYLLLSRFVLTCCAVDAYPVFIPIELPKDTQQYPSDTWLEIEGTMTTNNLKIRDRYDTPQAKRRLVLKASKITQIPTPKNPYSYQ
jgi:putative membrane protein